MKSIYLLLCLFVFGSCSKDELSKEGTLYGVLTDASTNKPLSNVSIRVKSVEKNLERIIITDKDGNFKFLNLTISGDYQLEVKENNYHPYTSEVITIRADENNKKDIRINPYLAFLSKINITKFPATDNGLPWDGCDFSNPDIYLVITTESGTGKQILVNTKTQDKPVILVDAIRPAFELIPPLLIERNKNYNIEIWDRDTGACGLDELVGVIFLSINKFEINTLKVEEPNNGTTMELLFTWK